MNPRLGNLANPSELEKLISGGQTGDRAALDVAIRHDFPHGGWCPKWRKAEDDPIGGQYELVQTPSANDLEQAEWNVRDTDGTVVFTIATSASPRSLIPSKSSSTSTCALTGNPPSLKSKPSQKPDDFVVPLGQNP